MEWCCGYWEAAFLPLSVKWWVAELLAALLPGCSVESRGEYRLASMLASHPVCWSSTEFAIAGGHFSPVHIDCL
jgi:hypothetical protein